MSENKGELTEIGEAEPQKQTQSARQGVIFLWNMFLHILRNSWSRRAREDMPHSRPQRLSNKIGDERTGNILYNFTR